MSRVDELDAQYQAGAADPAAVKYEQARTAYRAAARRLQAAQADFARAQNDLAEAGRHRTNGATP